MASSGTRSASYSGRNRRRRRTAAYPVRSKVSISAELVIRDDDLLREILLRLPAKPLFGLKLVSKRWCSLISDPQLHVDWKPPESDSAVFLRRYNSPHSDRIKFDYIPLIGYEKKRLKARRSFDCIEDPSGTKISQSCNGLLLCSSSTFVLDHRDTLYHVLNPTTKEFAKIPIPHYRHKNFVVSINLAFDPSVSLHYKVVALRSSWLQRTDCVVEIYCSESRSWMHSSESIPCSSSVVFENGVFLNGKIHWPSCRSESSIYYDIIQKKMMGMPMPHCRVIRENLHFGVCGGHLQYVELCEHSPSQLDVFVLEIDYSKWSVKYRVDLGVGAATFPEILCPYTYTSARRAYIFDVLCFAGGEVEGKSCLLLYIPGKIISYSFKDRSFRKVCSFRLRPCDYDNVRVCPWFTIHPCRETLFRV